MDGPAAPWWLMPDGCDPEAWRTAVYEVARLLDEAVPYDLGFNWPACMWPHVSHVPGEGAAP